MTARLAIAAFLLVPIAPPAVAQVPTAALDHLALYVSDLDRSTAFYKDVFGFAEIKSPLPIARWLSTGNGTTLHIVKGRTTPVENSKWDHFAVSCADMQAMIANLDTRKIAWSDIEGRHKPQIRADGVQQIFIRDPDGYWIEINDRLKPS
jgi:lactoylglutathione lyase